MLSHHPYCGQICQKSHRDPFSLLFHPNFSSSPWMPWLQLLNISLRQVSDHKPKVGTQQLSTITSDQAQVARYLNIYTAPAAGGDRFPIKQLRPAGGVLVWPRLAWQLRASPHFRTSKLFRRNRFDRDKENGSVPTLSFFFSTVCCIV